LHLRSCEIAEVVYWAYFIMNIVQTGTKSLKLNNKRK